MAQQQRIAAILDNADAIRCKSDHALALADELLKSFVSRDVRRSLTNPKNLPIVPIKEVGCVVTGNTPARVNADDYGPGIEWIKSDNINTPHHFLTTAE